MLDFRFDCTRWRHLEDDDSFESQKATRQKRETLQCERECADELDENQPASNERTNGVVDDGVDDEARNQKLLVPGGGVAEEHLEEHSVLKESSTLLYNGCMHQGLLFDSMTGKSEEQKLS